LRLIAIDCGAMFLMGGDDLTGAIDCL
jgi:hypothetical protein